MYFRTFRVGFFERQVRVITYKIGDMFREVDFDSPTIKLIPHCCNDIDGYGLGFAGAVSRHFPLAKERYHQWFRMKVDIESGKPFRLGQFQTVKVHSHDPYSAAYILNMIGQKGTKSPDNPKPVKYGHLFECVKQVGQLLRIYTVNNPSDHPIEVITVKFGSDLAGGDWNIIEEFVQDNWVLPGVSLTVWSL